MTIIYWQFQNSVIQYQKKNVICSYSKQKCSQFQSSTVVTYSITKWLNHWNQLSRDPVSMHVNKPALQWHWQRFKHGCYNWNLQRKTCDSGFVSAPYACQSVDSLQTEKLSFHCNNKEINLHCSSSCYLTSNTNQ